MKRALHYIQKQLKHVRYQLLTAQTAFKGFKGKETFNVNNSN